MSEVIPFKGVIYRDRKNISRLVTPPYDVISPEEQDKYYHVHPDNIIRLILGKEHSGDGGRENKYTRASRFLEKWLEKGILEKDANPAFYVLGQEFTVNGKRKKRLGFLGLIRLEEFGKNIFPHETTLSAPRADRFKLISACRANLSPIFSFYSDSTGAVRKVLEKTVRNRPLGTFTMPDRFSRVRNRYWRVDNRADTDRISKLMRAKKVFIADGHHRYETAMAYLRTRKEIPGYSAKAAYNYVLMYFARLEDKGLVILPAHRVLSRKYSLENLPDRVRKAGFKVMEMTRAKMIRQMSHCPKEKCAIGFYTGGKKFYMIQMSRNSVLPEIPMDRSARWKKMDVSVLHYFVFRQLFTPQEIEKISRSEDVKYVIPHDKVISTVNKEKCAAFFINPTRINEVRAVAGQKECLPGKSTYFYPKLPSGIVIHKF